MPYSATDNAALRTADEHSMAGHEAKGPVMADGGVRDPHLTQAQLAHRLGVSQRTLEGWRYRGKGPAYSAWKDASLTGSPTSNGSSRSACRSHTPSGSHERSTPRR